MEIEQKVKMRLGWIQMYQQTQNAGLVCRRCGISRPTLRKWVRRYQELGQQGLVDQSRCPKTCEPKKVLAQQNSKTMDFGIKTKAKIGSQTAAK